jgi:hypothetical protein
LRSGDLSLRVRRGCSSDRNREYLCALGCDRQTASRHLASFVFALASSTILTIAILAIGFANVDTASAQTPSAGILTPGNAVVTGFSGAPPPTQIMPGVNPGDLTFIDPNGPSARVFNLQAPGASPQAQVLSAPSLFTVTAAQIGQVFGVTTDNATPPNIYLAATSAYGLPIVVPGQGGVPARTHQGSPGASFMAGLFGPAAQSGGPGSIWRIDGVTGGVNLFANVTLDGAVNSGPALGGLAFDAASASLLVADRQTGMIHRFNLSGTEIGRYDHGVQGLAAAGRPQVPYSPSPLDITNPQFSSDNPATWHYASPQRLILGLVVHAGRLYYAVAAGLQIWSVSIASNGSFGTDARMEVQVPPALGPTEISKIVFDDSSDMILAERAAATGDYELMAVAQPGIGRVLRYEPVPNPPGGWQSAPDQYAIGFPDPNTNANGGVAVGYGYDANGNLDRTSCGGFVWSTGEQLRVASNPHLATILGASGPLDVNGLQGNGIALVVPANVPPIESYFVDYAAQLDDLTVRGHIGDIAIPIICGQAGLTGIPSSLAGAPGLPFLPPPPTPPLCQGPSCSPSQCAPGTSQQPGFLCCPRGWLPGPSGKCQSSCPNGATDPQSLALCMNGFNPVAGGNGRYTCLNGSPASAQPGQPGADITCLAEMPFANPANCPQGYSFKPDPNLGGAMVCLRTPLENTCRQQGMDVGLNGTCQQICPPGSGDFPFPIIQCCPKGETPQPNGSCGPSTPPPPPPNGCGPGTTTYCELPPNAKCLAGSCCPSGSTLNAAGSACVPTGPTCDPNSVTVCCPTGQIPQPNGSCGTPPPPPPNNCKPGTTTYCLPLDEAASACGVNQEMPTGNGCCPAGSKPTLGGCVLTSKSCPPVQGASGPVSMCCPPNQAADFVTGQCCPAGELPDSATGQCQVPPPPKICPSGSTIYCQPQGTNCSQNQKTADGCCPTGSKVVDGGCVATGPTGCGSGVPTVCCPAGQVPDFLTGKCLTPPVSHPRTPNRPPGTTGDNCPTGYSNLPTGECCLSRQISSTGQCCPADRKPGPNGACEPLVPISGCPPGEIIDLHNNTCGPLPACPAGQTRDAAGVCACPADQKIEIGTGKCVALCSDGEVMSAATGRCGRATTTCPAGEIPDRDGTCVQAPTLSPTALCPIGQTRNAAGACVSQSPCAAGDVLGPNGTCIPATLAPCPAGELRNAAGVCVPVCPAGEITGPNGTCVQAPPLSPTALCPIGQTRNAAGNCVSQSPCPAGDVLGPTGTCIPASLAPCPAGELRNADGACVMTKVTPCPSRNVPREAYPGDRLCVSPEVHDQTIADNNAAPSRTNPNGNCVQGYVWREAIPSDHICVKPATRAQTQSDNRKGVQMQGPMSPPLQPDTLKTVQTPVPGGTQATGGYNPGTSSPSPGPIPACPPGSSFTNIVVGSGQAGTPGGMSSCAISASCGNGTMPAVPFAISPKPVAGVVCCPPGYFSENGSVDINNGVLACITFPPCNTGGPCTPTWVNPAYPTCPSGWSQSQSQGQNGPAAICTILASCPTGYSLSQTLGECEPLPPSCPNNREVRNASGACVCLAGEVSVNGTCMCPAGQGFAPNGTCESCAAGQLTNSGMCCPAEQRPQSNGTCMCPANQVPGPNGSCLQAPVKTPMPPAPLPPAVPPVASCPSGYVLGADGMCDRVTTPGARPPLPTPPACPPGVAPGTNGCRQEPVGTPNGCGPGLTRNADGACVSSKATTCPTGETMTPRGCEKPSQPTPCPSGEVRTFRGCKKVSTPSKPITRTEPKHEPTRKRVLSPNPPRLTKPNIPLRLPPAFNKRR